MDLQQIIQAVDAGKVVHWVNECYRVIKDEHGRYLMAFMHGSREANYIGLTRADGITLNGSADSFYLADEWLPAAAAPVRDVGANLTGRDLVESRALLKLVDAAWRVFTDAGDWQARAALGASLAGMPTRSEISELLASTPRPSRLNRPGQELAPSAVVTIPASLDSGIATAT